MSVILCQGEKLQFRFIDSSMLQSCCQVHSEGGLRVQVMGQWDHLKKHLQAPSGILPTAVNHLWKCPRIPRAVGESLQLKRVFAGCLLQKTGSAPHSLPISTLLGSATRTSYVFHRCYDMVSPVLKEVVMQISGATGVHTLLAANSTLISSTMLLRLMLGNCLAARKMCL